MRFVFQKFKLDKDRGAAAHPLMALKMDGTTVKSLVDFKSKLGSLEQNDMPSDSALRSLLFEDLKGHPKMALSIDKFLEAKTRSSKRTWLWLYQKMEEAIETNQLDEHTGHVEKALQSTGGHKVNAGPSKPEKMKGKRKRQNMRKNTEKNKPQKMKNLQRRRLERTKANLQNPKKKVRKSPRLPSRLQQWALLQELQKEQERVKVNPIPKEASPISQHPKMTDRSSRACILPTIVAPRWISVRIYMMKMTCIPVPCPKH